MTLTEKEAEIFPKEFVSPKMAVGEMEPKEVILYQLNVNCCPHVTLQNLCSIYEKRPLMCRSFPIVAGAISSRCRVFSYRKPGLSYSEPYHMKEQLQASDKLTKHIEGCLRRNMERRQTLWEFDLNTKKWHRIG